MPDKSQLKKNAHKHKNIKPIQGNHFHNMWAFYWRFFRWRFHLAQEFFVKVYLKSLYSVYTLFGVYPPYKSNSHNRPMNLWQRLCFKYKAAPMKKEKRTKHTHTHKKWIIYHFVILLLMWLMILFSHFSPNRMALRKMVLFCIEICSVKNHHAFSGNAFFEWNETPARQVITLQIFHQIFGRKENVQVKWH